VAPAALIYHDRVRSSSIAMVMVASLVAGCAAHTPIEQRTTQGPSAYQLWSLRMATHLGREPNFDERRHFDDELETRITRYLNEHPEDANALNVSTFRFARRVSVGMSGEQVAILLGTPLGRTTDPGELQKRARKFWPDIKDRAREGWAYPLGWTVYFDDEQRVVDITQFHAVGGADNS
jgi:hypothetical protein